MTVTTRKVMATLGLMGTYTCLYTGWSHAQVSDNLKVALFASQKSSATKIDLPRLVYPYYEWVAKDTALAWIQKPNGPVVAAPLTGETREEKRISGASDLKELGNGRPYAMKMSPDGSKILYLMGGSGMPAGGWRVGTLDGTSYTHGALIDVQGRDLVWRQNSREWVSLIGDNRHVSAVHYYTDGVTPPLIVPIKDFAPNRDQDMTHVPHILGLRKDGIAIVPVWGREYPTETIDFYRVDIDKGRVLSGKHQVVIPKGMHVWEMHLSHRGDRIAWLFHTEVVRVSEGKSTTDDVLDIWLSHADGTGLKHLSDFTPHVLSPDVPGEPYYKATISVDCPIRWTIDDTAISCLEGDVLQLTKVK